MSPDGVQLARWVQGSLAVTVGFREGCGGAVPVVLDDSFRIEVRNRSKPKARYRLKAQSGSRLWLYLSWMSCNEPQELMTSHRSHTERRRMLQPGHARYAI